MKKRISALLLALAATGFARQDYTRTFEKSVNVQPGASVRVEHKFGDVTVRAVPGQSVTIHADIRASAPDEQQAREFAEHVEILVEQSSGVSIRTRYPETPRPFFGMRNVSFSVHYDITVPGNSPLSI